MTTVVLNTVSRKVEVFSSARDVQARAEIAAHKAAANPHPQYLADADLAEVALSGDAGDLTSGTVPDARMPNWIGYNVASRAALETAHVRSAVDAVRINGFTSAGDGGGARYKRVASEPSHEGKIQSADGAWWELAETRPTPQMFGAKADDSTDDSEAINRCGAFVNAKGLGLLYIPDGTYRVNESATALAITGTGFSGIVAYDGMTIRGQSRGGTIIKSADGVGRRLIVPASDTDISYQIESLTLDGNKATHAVGTSGIRVNSANGNVRIHNVISKNNVSYGIGVAYDAVTPVTNLNLFVSDSIVEENGTDGFDAKITHRAFLERVVARNNGGGGIDVRGHYVVTSDCLAYGNGTWGIATGRVTSDQSGIAHHQSVNCIAHGNGGDGMRCRDQAESTSEIIEFIITNPMSYGNGGSGIGVICGRGSIIVNSGAIYENGTYGIAVTEVSGSTYSDPENLHVEVVGTAIRDNTAHGIFGGADLSFRLSVIGGHITAASSQRCISGGFRSLRCAGVRFEDGAFGIVWANSATAADDGEVSGCVFDGQTVWGVSASSNSHGVLTGCTFRGTNGFRTLPSALGWLLAGNDFSAVSGTQTSDGNSLLAIVGMDTSDADIQLTPKGTGHVRFGSHSALSGESVSGYIEIKDAGGTTRKLAVVS